MDIPTLLMSRFSTIDRAFYETERTQSYLRVEVKGLSLNALSALTNEIITLLNAEVGVERSFILDVYTKPLGQNLVWDDLPNYLNALIDVTLNQSVKNHQSYVGTLLSYDEQGLTMRWNAKGQMRTIKLTKENITTLKVGIKW